MKTTVYFLPDYYYLAKAESRYPFNELALVEIASFESIQKAAAIFERVAF